MFCLRCVQKTPLSRRTRFALKAKQQPIHIQKQKYFQYHWSNANSHSHNTMLVSTFEHSILAQALSPCFQQERNFLFSWGGKGSQYCSQQAVQMRMEVPTTEALLVFHLSTFFQNSGKNNADCGERSFHRVQRTNRRLSTDLEKQGNKRC